MVDADVMAMGGSPKKHAQAESCSSVAFRATVSARLSANADGVLDAALRAAASHEARVSAAAVSAILAANSASAEATTAATNAASTLRTQLSAAATISASATAFSNWNAAISGSGSVNGSVVGNYLGLNGVSALTVQPVVTATNTAATVLESTLKTLSGTLSATGTLDLNLIAQTVVTAYTTFQSAVDLQANVLSVFGAKSTPALEVVATASSSFRLQ